MGHLKLNSSEYEYLRQLFGLNATFKDIHRKRNRREYTFIRKVLVWAYVHSVEQPRTTTQAASLFGVVYETARTYLNDLNLLASTRTYSLADERLELLLETAGLLVDHIALPESLLRRIDTLRRKEAEADSVRRTRALWAQRQRAEIAERNRERPRLKAQEERDRRMQRALMYIGKGMSDADICARIGVTQNRLKIYKRTLKRDGALVILEKKPESMSPQYRGTDKDGNMLFELSPVELMIVQMALARMSPDAICRQLWKKNIKKTKNAVIGIAYKFGGFKKLRGDRLRNSWIYARPPRRKRTATDKTGGFFHAG